MMVKIRKETNRYLAYFINSRRIVGVNEVGSVILDLLFNQNTEVEEIVDTLAKRYKIPPLQVKADLAVFLEQIESEIDPDGFNVIEQEQLEAPLGVELEITTSCNLPGCRHCFQWDHVGIHMPTQKATGIITSLANFQVCEASLIGGEPFKHPGLLEILHCCQDHDMAVNLVTNGTLITNEVTNKLANIGRLVVIISMDGTREVHDYIRGQGH